MTEAASPELFNSPLETGIRSVVLLNTAYPHSFDLKELTWLDHLVVHTGDILAPRHDQNNPANISTYLLTQMNAAGHKVAIDASGTPNNLTFRDIAGIVLTNEIAIQSENSPIETGERGDQTRERSVFKFMLTGVDDSAIVPTVKPKDFRTGRAAKVEVLQELIDQISADLTADYSDLAGLKEQGEKIEESLRRVEATMAGVGSETAPSCLAQRGRAMC